MNPTPVGPQRDEHDLAAFLSTLTAGTTLVLVGHVTAGSLTTICVALMGLYGAWLHFRPPRGQ